MNTQETEAADPIARIAHARRQQRKLWTGLAVGILLLAALLPMGFGLGPFALGNAGKDEIQVWYYNTTDQPATIGISRIAPFASPTLTELGPYDTHFFTTHTGTWALTLTGAGATQTQEVELKSHTIVSHGSQLCYAVFDISQLYNEAAAQVPAFTVIDRIRPETSVYQTSAQTLVPPRARMPKIGQTPVHWVEDFDCGLLDPSLEEALKIRAQTILMEREVPDENP